MITFEDEFYSLLCETEWRSPEILGWTIELYEKTFVGNGRIWLGFVKVERVWKVL
jgi:hypothetical protein